MEEKDAFSAQKPPSRICSVDRYTSTPHQLPIYVFLPKEPAIACDGGVGALKLAMCACGRRKPNRRLGLHFGKEEMSLENKKTETQTRFAFRKGGNERRG